jgi:hypothetical protein
MFVGIASQKGRGATSHENLGEFSVLLLRNILKYLIVLFEIGLNKVQLLISAPEARDLLLRLKD